jgi:hypothetical protein
MAEIDRHCLETPFCGAQQVTWHLRAEGRLSPKAAHQGPVAALRFLDDAPHRPTNRAYPRGLGVRSNGSE